MASSPPSSSRPARRAAAGRSTLEALPPDLLAAVAALLGPGPADRLCLAECSRMLLTASRRRSPSWWGELEVELGDEASVQGFEAWLARRRPGLRELEAAITWRELPTFALPSPPLPDLELLLLNAGGYAGVYGCSLTSAQLLEISAHTQLTSLAFVGLELPPLPPQFGGLTRLRSLTFEEALPPGGLEHLSSLQRCLTSLVLTTAGIDVAELPPSLSGLSSLRHMRVSATDGSFRGWQHLPTQLTSLDLQGCIGVDDMPPVIGSMAGLKDLNASRTDMWRNLDPVAGLPLTRLNLNNSTLFEVPPAFSTLGLLVSLDIGSWELVEDGVVDEPLQGGLEHLSGLTHLTSLGLGLLEGPLPAFVSTLTALRHFDCMLNGRSDESLAHLGALHSLTSLRVGCRDLQAVPPALRCLPGLRSLQLVNTWAAKPAGLCSGWQHISHLSLTQLAVSGSKAGGVPAQLSCLVAL
ncbi:hypothetical protein ABPG75_009115 [Micractinium tetrahymenae]